MDLSSDELRALHAEADAIKRARIAAMTPLERMEEAFRLFQLGKDMFPRSEDR